MEHSRPIARSQCLIVALGGSLLSLAVHDALAQASTTFTATEFGSGDWTIAAEGGAPTPGGTGTFEARTAGGNPDDYGRSIVQLPANPACPTGSFILALNSAAVYDPATSGAIDSIDYSWDMRMSPDEPVTTVGTLGLQQDGFFYGAFDVRLSTGAGTPTWNSYSTNGLTAADFEGYPGWNNAGQPANPDFSASGSPITFGHVTGASRGFGGFDALCASPPPAGADLDNWQVDVSSSTGPSNGELSFEADTYNVAETDGTVTVVVERNGGTDGEVSVDYMTVPETATADADYSSDTDTLVFADGVSEQDVAVTILDDDLVEGDEAFRLELMNPTGGAIVVLPQTATVNIADDDAGYDVAIDMEIVPLYENIGGATEIQIEVALTASNLGPGIATQIVGTLLPFPDSAGDYAYVSDDTGGLFTQNLLAQWNWQVGDIAPNTSRSMTAVFRKVEPSVGAELTLGANLQAQIPQGEPDLANNEVFVTVPVGGADVSVSLTADRRADVSANGLLFFDAVFLLDVSYLSLSSEPAKDVVVTVDLPGSVIEADPEIPGCARVGATNDEYECRFDELSESFTTELLVSVNSNTTVSAVALVDSSNYDPDLTNNRAEDSVSIPPVESSDPPGPNENDSSFCFIATAAYGSPWQPNVVVLRSFRDEWLLTNVPGRWFVATYYELSPPIADWIAERDWARALVRAGLTPIVFAIEKPLWAFTGALSLMLTVRRRRWLASELGARLAYGRSKP